MRGEAKLYTEQGQQRDETWSPSFFVFFFPLSADPLPDFLRLVVFAPITSSVISGRQTWCLSSGLVSIKVPQARVGQGFWRGKSEARYLRGEGE